MSRRRRSDFSGEILPWEIEWSLVAAAVVAWFTGTAFYYAVVMIRILPLLAILDGAGVQADTSAIMAVIRPILWIAPLAGIPFAVRFWRFLRGLLLRGFLQFP